MKLLCIGDLHVKPSNLSNTKLFEERLLEHLREASYECVCLLGDVLDSATHIHSDALTRVYELIENLCDCVDKVIVVVGNHCMTNSSIFLTRSHWMHCLKHLSNVVVIDKVTNLCIQDVNFVASPFVPDGRFVEALNASCVDWRKAMFVLGHQLLDGAKMGHIVAEEIEKWELDYPMLVSGHIHSKQRPQPNLVYAGSAWQHSFAESGEDKSLLCLEVKNQSICLKEIFISGLATKKMLHCDKESFKKIDPARLSKTADIKVCVSGNFSEFKSLKATKHYKALTKLANVNVVFKPSSKDLKKQSASLFNKESQSFIKLLQTKLTNPHEKDLFNKYLGTHSCENSLSKV